MNITEVKTRSFTYYVLESEPGMMITTQDSLNDPHQYCGSEEVTSPIKDGFVEITKERHQELLREKERLDKEFSDAYVAQMEASYSKEQTE